MGHEFYLGLDLGQARDYSALAVLERSEEAAGRDAVTWAPQVRVRYRVRHVERMALRTPYPEVVARVAEVASGLRGAWTQAGCELMVDATGGRAVVDLLRREGLRCGLRPVTVTCGGSESESDGYYRVPKRELVTGLQVMLQTGELQIAKGMVWGEALLKEMREFRVRGAGPGMEVFEGPHDDLVFAVALAVWGAKRFVVGDLFGARRLI